MKDKTSVTLSKDVLAAIDRIAGQKRSRSAVIEGALRQYLKDRAKAALQKRDLDLINTSVEDLNAQAEDALEYQVGEE
jgi:metal-responsive CopG/Arc/MetJ family transcriptional regulator